jgi:hypothetical protein
MLCARTSSKALLRSGGVAGGGALNAAVQTGDALHGRWSQTHTCAELVSALRQAGLAATAPVAVGDYFPNRTPQRLAKKHDLCGGAKPQVHSHFFKNGVFGSVDNHNKQVDNGFRCLMRRRLVTNLRIEDGATDKALTA